MGSCIRFVIAIGVAFTLISFATFARGEDGDTFFVSLPASELTKIEADANAGNVDAIFLRYLYLVAMGESNNEELRVLRGRAASAGHPAAQYELCLLQSLADDESHSTSYCFEAALNGDAGAQSWLGLGLTLGVFGLKENPDYALSFYRQAAFQGHVSALARVGDAYSRGNSVEQDNVLAVYYWERAASLDDPSSLRELGRAYTLGQGISQDIDKALHYFNRAADLGDGAAQYYAGLLHRANGYEVSAFVMFALAVRTLSPGELRDMAIKARTEQTRFLDEAQMQRARSIIGSWKRSDPKPQPFIGGIEFIMRLQKALSLRGHGAGEADGLAGSKTRAAYREFVNTLQMGELKFGSPDIYYVAYKLNLFGREPPGPAAPSTSSASAEPVQKSAGASSNGQLAVRSGGSGFVINHGGYIVTNAHVVKGCASLRVVQGSDEPVAASVVEVSDFSDLAILQAPLAFPKPVSVRGGNPPKLGESIIVFGFPLTGVLSDQGNLTVGNLTALSGMRGDPSVLQISAPVQPGNSGGPVLDSKGHLIGIVVSKLDALAVAGVTDDIPQNVNFAIRATVLENLLQSRSIKYESGEAEAPDLPVTDLAERAKNATVMIQCLGS